MRIIFQILIALALFSFTMEQSKLYLKPAKEIASSDDDQDVDDSDDSDSDDPEEEDTTEINEFQPKILDFEAVPVALSYFIHSKKIRVIAQNEAIPDSIHLNLIANPPETC